MRLLINSIISTYLYLDMSNSYFPLGMAWLVQDIYVRGIRYAWAPVVLAYLYMDLHNFVYVDQLNIIIDHYSLIKVCAFENIAVISPIRL